MEPEQHTGGDGEVERQVGEAKQADESWNRVRGALHVGLEEEVQGPLECNKPECMAVGLGGVADDEASSKFVEAVEAENEDRFGAERVPPRQRRS